MNHDKIDAYEVSSAHDADVFEREVSEEGLSIDEVSIDSVPRVDLGSRTISYDEDESISNHELEAWASQGGDDNQSCMQLQRRHSVTWKETSSNSNVNISTCISTDTGPVRPTRPTILRESTTSLLATLDKTDLGDPASIQQSSFIFDSIKMNFKNYDRYSVGDKVLVYLACLNYAIAFSHVEQMKAQLEKNKHSGEEAIRDSVLQREAALAAAQVLGKSTGEPVNKYGYPQGQGRTTLEKKGPWVYVLATIVSVHFGENSRYYMVQREDTGLLQRAEAAWFSAITPGSEGEKAAISAAMKSRDQMEIDNKNRARRPSLSVHFLIKAFYSFRIPCSTRSRAIGQFCRSTVENFLFGNHPFTCQIRITSVNILVLCSIFFFFCDQINLSFIPPHSDRLFMYIAFVVWVILSLELIFLVLIRPRGYQALLTSEDCYKPSTARFINNTHLFFEVLALVLFVPEFANVMSSRSTTKPRDYFKMAPIFTAVGDSLSEAILGHLFYALTRFRIFSVVRHWKNMWLNRIYDDDEGVMNFVNRFLFPASKHNIDVEFKKAKDDDEFSRQSSSMLSAHIIKHKTILKGRLDSAANIGTALMVVNSHRAMIFLIIIFGLLPFLFIARPEYGQNRSYQNMVALLNDINIQLPGDDAASCSVLMASIDYWLLTMTMRERNGNHTTDLVRATLLPSRCSFQLESGLITDCTGIPQNFHYCDTWKSTKDAVNLTQIADKLDLRYFALLNVSNTNSFNETYRVEAVFNLSRTVSNSAIACLLMQASLLAMTLVGLAVLRGDASRLVIYPLRRMLKIVLRYAEDPLSTTIVKGNTFGVKNRIVATESKGFVDEPGQDFSCNNALGRFETEQLITAITKITDLLRKCWGVAGAGIISANLATDDETPVVFNPTVPGKRVYALFGFAAIDDFNHILRSLDQDVMILINDVANVVHSEVFRWGFGDRGQCNKNLGSSFLMVFRIGDFEEVEAKKIKATGFVFDWVGKGTDEKNRLRKRGHELKQNTAHHTIRKSHGPRSISKDEKIGMGTLQLASLPGINDFTDRALIGMLKSYAGVYRSKSLKNSLKNWEKDFRLGAGVGAFSVDMIFGMDAGWAVEGAVGSEYKIDATYLSPHVNMASRMMSACRQYGLTILLSQAVEQLLSEQARSKLRHIDTVTVKGSTKEQRIYTYDARCKGVNFFLYDRTPEQADIDSDNYSSLIWDQDQDLLAMRNHISDLFLEKFNKGRDYYINGSWTEAIKTLQEANSVLIEYVLEEGQYQSEIGNWQREQILDSASRNGSVKRLRTEFGDGPSQELITYMEKEGGCAPKNWRGVRPLVRK